MSSTYFGSTSASNAFGIQAVPISRNEPCSMRQYENKTRAKLTKTQAIEIFKLKKASDRPKCLDHTYCKKIAKQYGVNEKTVRDIWRGRTWSRDTNCPSDPLSNVETSPTAKDILLHSALCAGSDVPETKYQPRATKANEQRDHEALEIECDDECFSGSDFGAESVCPEFSHLDTHPHIFSHGTSKPHLAPQDPAKAKAAAEAPAHIDHSAFAWRPAPSRPSPSFDAPASAASPHADGAATTTTACRASPPAADAPRAAAAAAAPRAFLPSEPLPDSSSPDDPFHDDWMHWDRSGSVAADCGRAAGWFAPPAAF